MLCWFSTIGYRITGVDQIESVDQPDAAQLNVHDWAEFPAELVLTLKDPLLPPGLLLELSGTWNNPCRSLIPSRDDAHWEPYKGQWCAAKMAAYSYNFVPCNIWGEFPAREVRRQKVHVVVPPPPPRRPSKPHPPRGGAWVGGSGEWCENAPKQGRKILATLFRGRFEFVHFVLVIFGHEIFCDRKLEFLFRNGVPLS